MSSTNMSRLSLQLEDYLVDDEIALRPAELESLRQECALYSSNDLALFPGFTITTNIGNKMMVYGPDAMLPTARFYALFMLFCTVLYCFVLLYTVYAVLY